MMSTVKSKGKFHVKLSACISQILTEGGVIWGSLRNLCAKLKRGEVFDVSRETQKF